MTATASTSAIVDAGVRQRLVQHRHDPAQVGARRDLGHDPAGRRVERDLARDDVGVDPPCRPRPRAIARLVARRLDGEDERAAHAAPASGRAGVARRRRSSSGSRVRRRGGVERRRGGRRSASRIGRVGQRLRRHDQRVLLVVAVVARPDPDRPEPVLLVQPAGGQVGQPDLERRLAGVAVDGEVQQRQQQPLPDPPAAVARVDRERRDVRLVDHQPDAAVGHDLARRPCRRGSAARRFASSSWRYAWGGHGVVNEARSMSWTAGRSSIVIGRIRRTGASDAHRGAPRAQRDPRSSRRRRLAATPRAA